MEDVVGLLVLFHSFWYIVLLLHLLRLRLHIITNAVDLIEALISLISFWTKFRKPSKYELLQFLVSLGTQSLRRQQNTPASLRQFIAGCLHCCNQVNDISFLCDLELNVVVHDLQ